MNIVGRIEIHLSPIERLEALGFTHAASIVELTPNRFKFESVAGSGRFTTGLVYAWVRIGRSGGSKVVYVGKVNHGATWKEHCRHHQLAFAHADGTRSRRDKVRALVRAGSKLRVYVRKADSATVLGVNGISQCEAEVEALQQIFCPPWNKVPQ